MISASSCLCEFFLLKSTVCACMLHLLVHVHIFYTPTILVMELVHAFVYTGKSSMHTSFMYRIDFFWTCQLFLQTFGAEEKDGPKLEFKIHLLVIICTNLLINAPVWAQEIYARSEFWN